MTESNTHTFTDNQNEEILNSLRNEIASLKFQLKRRDDRVGSLDVMLNTVMESHNAEVRAYEDLKDKLEDLVEMLRNRVPHSDILDFLKVKDRAPLWQGVKLLQDGSSPLEFVEMMHPDSIYKKHMETFSVIGKQRRYSEPVEKP